MSDFRDQLMPVFAFIGLITLTSISYAQGKTLNWACKLDSGECIGKVRLVVKKAFWEDAVGTYALSSFPNREYLFEDFSNAKTKKVFHLVSIDRYLFFGVTGQEEASAMETRYQHKAGRVVFAMMIALVSAFPEGENRFPIEWETRKLELEGQMFDISGRQAGYNKFLFRVQNYAWDVEGEWDVTKPEPWPDNEPMAGWTIGGHSPSPILGLVRKVTRN